MKIMKNLYQSLWFNLKLQNGSLIVYDMQDMEDMKEKLGDTIIWFVLLLFKCPIT